jgi:hypothetical protein
VCEKITLYLIYYTPFLFVCLLACSLSCVKLATVAGAIFVHSSYIITYFSPIKFVHLCSSVPIQKN